MVATTILCPIVGFTLLRAYLGTYETTRVFVRTLTYFVRDHGTNGLNFVRLGFSSFRGYKVTTV